MQRTPKFNFTIKDKFFAHLETWRPYTIMWCGLVSLTGSIMGFGGFPPFKIAILTLFIPMMGWIAGLYLADYLDKNLDAIQKPHRPIPSGRIKPKEALFIGAIFAIAGLLLSISLSLKNFIIVFIVAILVFAYARFSKPCGILGNLNRGFIIVVTYFFGVFNASQSIQSIPLYIWLLAFVFLIHDTNSNLIGSLRDMEGDKKGGYRTIPVKYGVRNTVYISSIFTIIWFSLAILIPFHFQFLKNGFYLMMITDLFIVILLYIYLFSSINHYSREKALNFHKIFVIERIILASAFIFGIVNIHISIVIFISALLITAVSQYLIRGRYEFVGVRE